MSYKKSRTAIRGLIAFVVAALVSSLAIAAAPAKGNEGKGRYFFRQTCKDCHTKGAKGGEVTPLTKTTAQWKSYFVKGKHNGQTLASVMPAEKLRDVETFLVMHAADSLQPETCGK